MRSHLERHVVSRIGWLRAAVLGANDGLVSTASLVVGVAAASTGRQEVLVAGIAGLVAGAMSMAAGEFVSVSSQADAEAADIAKETRELAEEPEKELAELAAIFVSRGVEMETAEAVARQLTARDALGAHAREELGISTLTAARPVQAAFASAASFAAGAVLPLLTVLIAPEDHLSAVVSGATLACLAVLGTIGARAGGASPLKPALRVMFWGALAMAATAGIGSLVGAVV
ncbi:MAG: VIT family protein [Alphaproteobacteria bacterium]|nr:VIT family protein [Alphaproteobacteria bacterium]